MRKSLNGKWELAYFDTESADCGKISATVPGNVELDLAQAGMLPQDLFMGKNVELAEKYETYAWTYSTKFDCEDPENEHRLLFEGVDTVAEYYVNGEKIGSSQNMLVEHVFTLSKLRKTGNELRVEIRPVALANKENRYTTRLTAAGMSCESSFIRKAAHTYGWDIMPRAVSAGIWKDVTLETVPENEFLLLNATTDWIGESAASVCVNFSLRTRETVLRQRGFEVRFLGKCGESEFSSSYVPLTNVGFVHIHVENPKLWHLKDRGEANLYELTALLCKDGKPLCEKKIRFGIRTIELTVTEEEFFFKVNGEKIYVMGTNWVPLSPYHSQDKERLPMALELLKKSRCNAVRCWGGNVYESDAFFDFMDENGILVWQDFSFACNMYSHEEPYLNELKEEARKLIQRLRNHPSLALWAGDNEIDQMYLYSGYNPEQNRITRETLRQAVYEHDWRRPYLPSSPYVMKKAFELRTESVLPERHLWGKRDYFKSDFYARYHGQFISEIGYHGCVERSSAEKFLPKDAVENRDSYEWALHSTDIYGSRHRVKLMEDQILFLFGSIPETFDDFARASQLSQAEAYKFFVENARCNGEKTGVMWWNLLDGWPQFSDAVVDYYGKEKLAFHNICRSQAPVLCTLSLDENGNFTLWAINDTPSPVTIDIQVTDGDTGETVFAQKTTIAADGKRNVSTLQFFSKQRLILLRWTGRKERIISSPDIPNTTSVNFPIGIRKSKKNNTILYLQTDTKQENGVPLLRILYTEQSTIK